MASPTRSAMQSATPNSTAAHMNASFACSMRPAFMIHPSPVQYIGVTVSSAKTRARKKLPKLHIGCRAYWPNELKLSRD